MVGVAGGDTLKKKNFVTIASVTTDCSVAASNFTLNFVLSANDELLQLKKLLQRQILYLT